MKKDLIEKIRGKEIAETIAREIVSIQPMDKINFIQISNDPLINTLLNKFINRHIWNKNIQYDDSIKK